MRALHRAVDRGFAEPRQPVRQRMRPGRQRPPARARVSSSGPSSASAASSAVVSGSTISAKDSSSSDSVGPAGALALERVLPARVDGGKQIAHVIEEVQRLTAGQPLGDSRKQVGRAVPAPAPGTCLPPALVPRHLPPSLVRVPSALGHERQLIAVAGTPRTCAGGSARPGPRALTSVNRTAYATGHPRAARAWPASVKVMTPPHEQEHWESLVKAAAGPTCTRAEPGVQSPVRTG